MKTVIFLLFAVLAISNALLGLGRRQSVAVSGRVLCNGAPAKDVKVKLYEKEKLKDVKLDEVRTDSNGYFKVSGAKTEITNIDPKVNIYHRCNFNGVCYRKFGITIPDSAISLGEIPKTTYDMGVFNLANRMPDESIDCIN